MNIQINPIQKSCGECTECCRGSLRGVENGELLFGNGIPCSKVSDKGCTIYNKRPNVCSNYFCWWLKESEVPDFMRPDRSKILVSYDNVNGFNYLSAIILDESDYLDGLSNFLRYAAITKTNVTWRMNSNSENRKLYWLGSTEFMEMAYNEFNN